MDCPNRTQVDNPILPGTFGQIGSLYNWFTLHDSTQINYMDAALVKIHPKHLARWKSPRPSSGQYVKPQIGMRVVKNGFATQETNGIITHIEGQGSATFSGRTNHFSGIIQIEGLDGSFSKEGDSGSVLLSWPDYHMIGVIFAKVGKFSWALPISRIKPLLG